MITFVVLNQFFSIIMRKAFLSAFAAFALTLAASAQQSNSAASAQPSTTSADTFWLGADISGTTQMESRGARFYNKQARSARTRR